MTVSLFRALSFIVVARLDAELPLDLLPQHASGCDHGVTQLLQHVPVPLLSLQNMRLCRETPATLVTLAGLA